MSDTQSPSEIGRIAPDKPIGPSPMLLVKDISQNVLDLTLIANEQKHCHQESKMTSVEGVTMLQMISQSPPPELALVNSASSFVVAGLPRDLQALVEKLEGIGARTEFLLCDGPYHHKAFGDVIAQRTIAVVEEQEWGKMFYRSSKQDEDRPCLSVPVVSCHSSLPEVWNHVSSALLSKLVRISIAAPQNWAAIGSKILNELVDSSNELELPSIQDLHCVDFGPFGAGKMLCKQSPFSLQTVDHALQLEKLQTVLRVDSVHHLAHCSSDPFKLALLSANVSSTDCDSKVTSKVRPTHCSPHRNQQEQLMAMFLRGLQVVLPYLELSSHWAQAKWDEQGLNSTGVVSLCGYLTPLLAPLNLPRMLSPALFWTHTTPASLAAHLSSKPHGSALEAPFFDVPSCSHHSTNPSECLRPVYVLGMAAELPGANSVDAFWRNLVHAKDCVCDMTPERTKIRGWNIENFHSTNLYDENVTYSRRAGLLDRSVDTFDATFFGVSPLEAASMDPQHRLFLETSWHAIENAHLIGGADSLRSVTYYFLYLSSPEILRINLIL